MQPDQAPKFSDNDIARDFARGKRIAQVIFCVAGVLLLAAAYRAFL